MERTLFTCRPYKMVWTVVCWNLSGNETAVTFSILPWRMQSTEPCSRGLVTPDWPFPSPNSTLPNISPLSPSVSTSHHPASYLQSYLHPSLKHEWWAWKGDACITYTPCLTSTFNSLRSTFRTNPAWAHAFLSLQTLCVLLSKSMTQCDVQVLCVNLTEPQGTLPRQLVK